MSINVLPRLPGADNRDHGLVNSISSGKNRLRVMARPDFPGVSLCQLASRGQLAPGSSPVPVRVGSVLFIGSDLQMVGVNASVVAAQMPNKLSTWGAFAARKNNGSDVHAQRLPIKANTTVSTGVRTVNVDHTMLNRFLHAVSDLVFKPNQANTLTRFAGGRVTVRPLPVVMTMTKTLLMNRRTTPIKSALKFRLLDLMRPVITRAAETFSQVRTITFRRFTSLSHLVGVSYASSTERRGCGGY